MVCFAVPLFQPFSICGIPLPCDWKMDWKIFTKWNSLPTTELFFSTNKNYASHLYMLLRNIFKGEEYSYCQNFIIVIIIVKYIVIMFIMCLYEDIEWNERKRIEVLSFWHRHEISGEQFCWTILWSEASNVFLYWKPHSTPLMFYSGLLLIIIVSSDYITFIISRKFK